MLPMKKFKFKGIEISEEEALKLYKRLEKWLLEAKYGK
jgi:hypothetical protein